jgi:putative transposase
MPDAVLPSPALVVGVELGLKDFAALSNGERMEAPKFFRKAQRKLKRAQRVVSRRNVLSSKRRAKSKHRAAIIQAKIANGRKDFIHKITTDLVQNYDGICIEDLSVRGLARTKLAKSILDASFGEFRRQLEYKSIWNRRHLAVIDRWFPSSKACHVCGAVNPYLTLADRHWDFICGAHLDRDLNASLNIPSEGLKLIFAVGHTEKKNARSSRPKTSVVEAVCI